MNCCRIKFLCVCFCVFTRLKFCARVSYFVFSVFSLCCCFVVSTSAIECPERLVSEMTYYVMCSFVTRKINSPQMR